MGWLSQRGKPQHLSQEQFMAKTKSTSNPGGTNGSYTSQAPSADDVIKQQDQTMVNQNKLAIAASKAMDEQARNEFMKSMHEMQAKSIKSAGEALKGLA